MIDRGKNKTKLNEKKTKQKHKKKKKTQWIRNTTLKKKKKNNGNLQRQKLGFGRTHTYTCVRVSMYVSIYDFSRHIERTPFVNKKKKRKKWRKIIALGLNVFWFSRG